MLYNQIINKNSQMYNDEKIKEPKKKVGDGV